ncbi:MAG TPA: hypothetical protein VNT59_06045 [Ramlibacter sp.]|nr:hypothetical protein [Ramlibacter sp.]HWI81570.1 hypothetical protein [Ramlibacter sp.]
MAHRKALRGDFAERALQKLPRFDLIEQLKEQRSQQFIFPLEPSAIDHVANEVLAHTIRSAVWIRKPKLRKNAIARPWGRVPSNALSIDPLTLCCELPVAVKDGARLRLRTPDEGHSKTSC